MRQRVTPLEVFGLSPLKPALEQCWAAIAGDEHSPPTQAGLSSLRIFRPWLSLPLWLGKTRRDRRVPIYNLPNRVPAPKGEGYSVRVTYCRDYRGRQLSYDGHLGTDFAIPVGTEVTAAAPGIVRQVRNDMQRGGLKVCIDHGKGLITTSNHLARALVQPGQRVFRGEVIALSGMSSVDGVLFFPWLAPHVHFNVLLDGVPIDPFAKAGEVSLWLARNSPTPHRGTDSEELEPTLWSEDGVRASIEAVKDTALKQELEAIDDFEQRAAEVAINRVFLNHYFREHPPLTHEPSPRQPQLDLPFKAEDFDGVCFADDLLF